MSIDRIPLPCGDGDLFLCGLGDVVDDPDGVLASTGASTIVCLNERRELDQVAPAYAEWLRANRSRSALWFPIRNFSAESADATAPLLEMIVDRLESREGVVMHCAMGQGRAGTMAVCVLIALGSTVDEAVRTVAQNRIGAGPAANSQWALVDDVARSSGRL